MKRTAAKNPLSGGIGQIQRPVRKIDDKSVPEIMEFPAIWLNHRRELSSNSALRKSAFIVVFRSAKGDYRTVIPRTILRGQRVNELDTVRLSGSPPFFDSRNVQRCVFKHPHREVRRRVRIPSILDLSQETNTRPTS